MERRWLIGGAVVSGLLAVDVTWRMATGREYFDILAIFLAVSTSLVAVQVSRTGLSHATDVLLMVTGAMFATAAVVGFVPMHGRPFTWTQYWQRLEVFGAFLAVAGFAWIMNRVVGRRA